MAYLDDVLLRKTIYEVMEITVAAWTTKFCAQGSTPEHQPRISDCTEGGGESLVLIKCRAGKHFS